MVQPKASETKVEDTSFQVRKITKAGGTRYLNVNTILPDSWEWVRVSTPEIDGSKCTLRLEKVN